MRHVGGGSLLLLFVAAGGASLGEEPSENCGLISGSVGSLFYGLRFPGKNTSRTMVGGNGEGS